jgi:hypothetical protein
MEGPAGLVRYRLDDGRAHYGTVKVDELLFGQAARSIRAWPPPEGETSG